MVAFVVWMSTEQCYHADVDISCKILPIRAFRDNYIWAIHGQRHAVVVDPGDASVVQAFLRQQGLALAAILVTHHHHDHVDGIVELVRHHAVPVFGPARETIPGLTHPMQEGDVLQLPESGWRLAVLDIPGHTAGHVAYFGHGALFCGDTLFGCGCGRLFEGTAAQMNDSLTKLATLPAETRVYCAHEYTLANIAFALTIEPKNSALQMREQQDRARIARGEPTLPSTLAQEQATNPFLRCRYPEIRHYVAQAEGKKIDTDVEVFSILRRMKDVF